jgi:DNA-binding NtrC family response regulator
MERILVIDDEVRVRVGMRRFFEANGFEVLEAETAAAAEQEFRVRPPDLVILDYSLPEKTGLELMPVLKGIDEHVPIVMVTGHGTIDIAVQAVKQGADDFVEKPVRMPALLEIVQRVLESYRNRRLPSETVEDELDLTLTIEENERKHVERVLRSESGSVDAAAARLGISRSALYVRLKRYRS